MKKLNRFPLLIALGVLLFILADCSSSNTTSSSASGGSSNNSSNTTSNLNVDPCQFFTKEEASAALGKTVSTARPSTSVKGCGFLPAVDPSGPLDTSAVTVLTLDPAVFAGTKKAAQQGQTQAEGIIITSVGGIGDDAFFQASTRGGIGLTFLEVKKGNVVFSIDVENKALSADAQKSAEKQLAQIAVAKL